MRHRTIRCWAVSLFTLALLAAFGGPSAAQTVLPMDEADTNLQPTPAARPDPADVTPAKVQPLAASPAEDQPLAASPAETEEQPLRPIPDPINAGPVEVEAASFKGVTPGISTRDDVERAWGAPKEVRKQGAVLLQLYSVEPFDRVEVSYFQDKVSSIVIRFDKSFPAHVVAEQLALSNIRPVLVSNELGEILGQVYPERGVLFAFEPSDAPGKASMKVPQIILEPITADPFILRAETYLDSDCESSRNDLQQALKLEPQSARAHWLRARICAALGELDEAMSASGEAVRLEGTNARYLVTHARILGQMGRLSEAAAQARKAVQASQRRPHVKVRALCLLGDLLASGPQPDYKQAIQYHMQAASAAEPLAADRHPAVRQAAKEVLVNANLGAAHDIAWGTWKEKQRSVPRWLELADKWAEDLIANEGGSPQHRFRVAARALAACVGMRGKLDPDKWAQEAIQTGEALIAATDDPARKAQLQWDLGMALYDALQTYQMRNDHDTALKYGERAIEHLEQGRRQRPSPTAGYLLGRLYFRLGAIYAIRDDNHRAAISWFEKAVPLLERPLPEEARADLGRHGETFVSMGVSYWIAGQRDEAVALTEAGVAHLEQAVKQNLVDASTLAVPYGNLASMYRQLGRDEKAKSFEEMAAKVKTAKTR